MTKQQKVSHKKMLLQKCKDILQQRILTAIISMQNAQEAANEEEKSSAGDKYETSRAMSHIEKDMHARQLEENKKELSMLNSVECNTVSDVVSEGSIVDCNGTLFFIAAGLGKIELEGKQVFMVSPHAPLANLLFGKKVADRIEFNKKEFIITNVY